MIRDIFKIFLSVRWPNLVITGITLYISYYLLLIPAFHDAGIEHRLHPIHFLAIVISMIFIMAGGYIINDWMDAESDAANKKSGVISFIPRRTLLFSYITTNVIGFLLALWICFDFNEYDLLYIPLLVIALLLFYSTNLKSTPLAGNILIAFLSASIILLPMVADKGMDSFSLDFNNTAIYFLAFLAFMVSLIREMVKDMEDELGDRQSNLATFPVVFGMEAARWTAFVFFLFFLVLLALMLDFLLDGNAWSLMYLILFLILPSIYLCVKLAIGKSRGDFHSLSTQLKLLMLSGLIFAIVYYFRF